MDKTEALRRGITELSQRAYRAGLFTGTSGNLSCFLREEGLLLITPTSVRYEDLRPEDIVPLRPDGTALSAGQAPSSEWRMHAVIYEAMPAVRAVFHTHSPHAAAFAVTRQTIPAVLVEAHLFLGGDIRCAAYARPGTRAVGENALPALRDRGGCTLANHGVLAVGGSLEEAYLRAEYIEELARVCLLAKRLGEPVTLPAL